MRYEITLEKCDRCGGSDVKNTGSHNGRLIPAEPDAWDMEQEHKDGGHKSWEE